MKKMKKIFAAVLAAAMAMAVCSCGSSDSAEKQNITLNVYNWGEYISDGTDGTLDVIKQFEKETGITVNYTTYQTNEELYNKLKIGGVSYDVIIPSDYMIGKMIKEDMLEKLDYSNIPNYSLIDDKYKSGESVSYDPNCEYTVPYTAGRVGLVYNPQYVTEKVDSWNILWNEKYKGNILMFDNQRDAFGIAQFLLGQSVNSEDSTELEKAAQLLKDQKKVSPVYTMDQILEKMPNGDAWIAPYYIGDCLMMCAENEDLRFTVPKEGTNIFVDAMCIPKGSEHKAQAEQFINYMCRTDVALANIEYIYYSSPQKEVAAQHKQELIEEYGEEMASAAYPDDFGKVEMFKTLSDEANQKMTDLWVNIKTGN